MPDYPGWRNRPAAELVVITKTYDLILWSCQHTSRFPHQHRFVLGERMRRPLAMSSLLVSSQTLAAAHLAAERMESASEVI